MKYKNFILLITLPLMGCGTTAIKPAELRDPNQISCIYFSEPVSYKEKRGLLSIEWQYRLERGPYIAEKEDDEGTYFRAPPGGVHVFRTDMQDKPSSFVTNQLRDGGFWIPRDSKKSPKMYSYFSMKDAEVVIPNDSTNCSSFAYLKDPVTSKVSVVAFGAGGAIGGALGRTLAPNSQLSYGQAAVGGAIGMALVAALINADIGKIMPWEISDNAFINKIKDLSKHTVFLQKDNMTPVPNATKPQNPEHSDK